MDFVAAVSPFLGLLGLDSTYMRLVLEAGLFAKFILLLLLTLSVISWGVALDKWSLFRRVESQARDIRASVARMRTVHDLTDLMTSGFAGPLMGIIRETQKVLQRFGRDVSGREYLIADFQRASEKAGLDALTLMEKNLVVLSTTTTVSPFLGLLGTCWGIMVSFINIGKAGSASLDVVAPGIAEALIATIAGLGTAIPALVFYNMLTNRLRRVEGEMQSFAISIVDLLEREIRTQKVPT
ncbi:MAG TPA: MotA/TolQ/ExbB proton channel family protein [Candidatus Krumholzibacteria bacterium]|nr:MotA/TolQ/ExbB proton channel family protein [Candidatus Krumholzibacteria bacterium]